MKHVLIVDDDIIMNNSVKAMLADRYRVSQLRSGAQVMDFLRVKTPDLVLMDLYMPETDGRAVMEKMREEPAAAGIPVIFLGGELSPETEREWRKLGAVDFIKKPISRRSLIERVEYRLMEAQAKTRVRQLFSPDAGGVYRDDLTGLLNSRGIFEKCAEFMDDPDAGCALAFLDFDNISNINDIFGMKQADELIKNMGTILAELEQGGAAAGRLGGDKFMLLLPGRVTPAYVQELSDRIFEKLSKYPLKGFEPGAATFSTGVAFWPADGENFETIAAAADMALQRAKALGKNRVYFAGNLNIPVSLREEAAAKALPLDKLLLGRGSDKGVMTVQFGQLRILYRTLMLLPADVAGRVRAVMLTIDEEDYDPFKAGALAGVLGDRLSGVKAIAKYAGNQIVAITYGAEGEKIRADCGEILRSGGYGRVSVDIL